MIRTLFCVCALTIFVLMMCVVPLPAQQDTGETMYDLGVFDYEAGKYAEAETQVRKALESDPQNPDYGHLLGKILKETGRFDEAMNQLKKAFATAPDIPGLKYDLAHCYYKVSDFETSASMFMEISRDDPLNVLAAYHAGISLMKIGKYDAALPYFTESAEKSPTITANGRYYAGICYAGTGKTDKAADMFEYVRENADTSALRENAENWLRSLETKKRAEKPWYLYAKASIQYDDNVGLYPPDRQADEAAGEEEDFAVIGFFSGAYDFLKKDGVLVGAGYSHYQSWYFDSGKYDLTASMFRAYAKYGNGAVRFSLEYMPSFFWVDGESFVQSHRVKPGVVWRLGPDLETDVSYRFTSNNYADDERDGNANGLLFNLNWRLANGKAGLSAGAGYEDVSASDSIYAHTLLEGNLNFRLDFPWESELRLSGRYAMRDYDGTDPDHLLKREDDTLSASASISKYLFNDRLSLGLRYDYSDNDSNITNFDYKRNAVAVSAAVTY